MRCGPLHNKGRPKGELAFLSAPTHRRCQCGPGALTRYPRKRSIPMTAKLSRFLALPLVLTFAMLMFALPAKAEVISNTLESFSATVTVDCDNDGTPEDLVELSGDLHVLITETTN